MMFDYIIIGSGFAGSVIAERITNVLDKKVLLIEKRCNVGGNCYDYVDGNGIFVHRYGPHIFHTEIKQVWEYISNFTDWYSYKHEVLGSINGKKVPIPFNINSLDELIPQAEILEKKLVKQFGYDVKVPILNLREIKDGDIEFLANFVYEKVFLNYTKKQWGFKPEELDPSVTARVPINISKDNRYFQDPYQGVPLKGYKNLFRRMLSNSNINILLNRDFKDFIDLDFDEKRIYVNGCEFKGKLIHTGPIDEFFDYKFGKLPYRSLRFEFETHNKEYFQEVGTVNYPNDHDYTRITEFKHITGQKHPKTTIVKEYPQDYDEDVEGKEIPYYPIPKHENLKIYEKYKELSKSFSNVIFVGRLAEYKYYNMDLVVKRALDVFEEEIK